MITSMTGFGRGLARGRAGTITVELRSVNHRFLEVVIHAPTPLQLQEDRVRETVRRRLRRGRITGTVTWQPAASGATRVHLDAALARAYHRQIQQLAKQLRLAGPVTLEQVLSLPRIAVVETEDQRQAWAPLIERAAAQAATQLVRMRAREGRALAREVLNYVESVEDAVTAISARAPAVVEDHRARLQRRLQELAPDAAIEPQRLAAEVALFAANADIAEELARLRSHLAQFRRAVAATGEQGRTLDFMAQEMFRETNTIGAKANDYTITSHVIAIKGALEKIREQIQNVE